MKRRFSIQPLFFVGSLLLLVLSLLLTSCTGTPGTAKVSSTPTASDDNTITFSNVQETPTAGAIQVAVTLLDFSITSSLKTFHANTPYYFVVTNRGPSVHEFLIIPDKPDGTPLPMDVQYNKKLVEIEQIAPGTTMRTNLIFPSAPYSKYEIACQMRGHYEAGMKLLIDVVG